MTSGLVVSPVSASNLGDLQAQAQALEARISALGNQESALSEQYDAAVRADKRAEGYVAAAKRQVAAANDQADKAKVVLRADAVSAYVDNGSGSLSGSGPASSIAGADSSLLRAEYEQSLATKQSDSEDQYRLASKQANSAEANLRIQEQAAAANVKAIAADVQQVTEAQKSLQAAEAQDKGQIATLIAQQQAAALRAEQLAAEQRLATARADAAAAAQAANQAAAAALARSTSTTQPQTPSGPVPTTPTTQPPSSGGSGGGTTTPVAPPASSAAAAAVNAAESRVGDPYVWGAAGPSAFDCSGLVMWAYAQAGVSLPHYSGAQYADTTHISMSDLEPGDLVFFADPGEHVAMYVGNGEVVQAPYTGADVQIIPLYSEFVLASRVS